MTRRLRPLMIIAVALFFLCAGVAAPAASTSDSGSETISAVTLSENTETEAIEGAFGTNVSVPSEEFSEAERNFYSSRAALENRSESLVEIAEEIETANAYTHEDHQRSDETLDELETELQRYSNSERDARDELMSANLSSTERFLVLESIDEERNSTEATVDDALGQYETAVRTQQADVRSTVLVYLVGSLLVGLLAGTLLGAVIPVVEAKKTINKMRLSRDISYKKRAGLIPVVAGFMIVIGAVALLWYIGAINVIRVMI